MAYTELMIGLLTGIVEIANNHLLIKTSGGVGYLVHVTTQTFSTLSRLNQDQTTTLVIYTVVREDDLLLFGFESWPERQLFELLLSVSGVGPSTALNLVGAGHQALIHAIQHAELHFFTAIPRVGKKVAQKIIIELGNKLGELKSLDLGPELATFSQVKEALLGLGFSETAITKLQEQLDFTTGNVEDLLKQALKKLHTT